jgi:micrococcal nuclease
MRTLLVAAILLAACTPGTGSTPGVTSNDTSPPGDAATVIEVFDGDSLLALVDGEDVEIRLLGVNAPEASECHGDAARDFFADLVASGEMTLVADGEDSDQFGRALRYVYVDGTNVNYELLANGAALVIQGDHTRDGEFAAASDAAAAAGLGLWAADACGTERPPEFIEISDLVYNPGGRDEENMNGEWVTVRNAADQPLDLSAWILRDESTQNRYTFPSGFSLGSGQEVMVRSGCGSDSPTDLHWCADGPIWSNGGDTAILQTPAGTVVAWRRFSGDF